MNISNFFRQILNIKCCKMENIGGQITPIDTIKKLKNTIIIELCVGMISEFNNFFKTSGNRLCKQNTFQSMFYHHIVMQVLTQNSNLMRIFLKCSQNSLKFRFFTSYILSTLTSVLSFSSIVKTRTFWEIYDFVFFSQAI